MSREFTISHTSERTYTDRDIAFWVITAFEGGSTYWCDRAEAVIRDAETGAFRPLTKDEYGMYAKGGVAPYANPEFWDNGKRGYRMWDEYEENWADHVLSMASIKKALHYQPPKRKAVSNNWFRKVVDRLLSEDYDAGDADTLVQVAVFGEVVYG